MMLRIEKSGNKFTYLFQKKERIFSKDFFKAVAIALLLHLTALTLFRINSPPHENLPLLKPIMVEVIQNSSPHLIATLPLEIREAPGDSSYLRKIPPPKEPFKMHDPKPDFSSIEILDYETLNIDFDDD